MIRWMLWALCLLLVAPLAAAPLWQEDFTRGAEGWTPVGDPAAARLAGEAGKSGNGLRLTDGGALLSPAQPAAAGDWLLLTMQVRHLSGPGPLTLAMVGADGEMTAPPVPAWRSDLPADSRWHKVELTLAPPPGDWRLVLGAEAESVWTVDDLALAVAPSPRLVPDPWLKGLSPAQAPDPLPADWEPEGMLDATSREVGVGTELVVNVGGLRLSLPPELQTRRGERRPVLIYAENRGTVEKQVTVTVQTTAPGSYMPTYTVPLQPRGTTALRAPLQVLQTGDFWAKFTFSVREESAAVPVRVTVEPGYPILGQLALPLSSSLVPTYLPFSAFLWGTSPPLLLPGQGLRLPLPAAETPAALREELADRRPSLLQLAGATGAAPPAPEEVVAAYRGLSEGLLPHLPGLALVAPTYPVLPGAAGLQPDPAMRAAYEAGLASWVQSLAIGLSELPEGGVLSERGDGRLRALAGSFWEDLGRRYDFTPLRRWLAQQGPEHPLLLDLSALTTRAAPRLDSLLLARLLLEQSWQGSTGVLLSAAGQPLLDEGGRPCEPVYAALQELWRELAGATPMVVPVAPDGLCGTAPGSPVRSWAFLRGREGLLFLANDTSIAQDVFAELRAEPSQLQVLRLRAEGPAVTREIQGVFRFSEEARARRQPAVYLQLAPGEIVGLALQVGTEDWAWLRSVGKMEPRAQKPSGPPPASGDQPWWERGRPGF